MLWLERITVFPVKSLDGVDVSSAELLRCGSLEHDRRWRLVDLEGRVVNAKRFALLHAVRAEFVIEGLETVGATTTEMLRPGPNNISLAVDPSALEAAAIPGGERLAGLSPDTFPLVPGAGGPCGWLSEALGFGVLLVERRDGGFPDDRHAAGPTVAATATLATVADWFSLDLEEARRRFRVNLEIGGGEAFWEDAMASPAQDGLGESMRDLPADPYADLPPPEGRGFGIGAARLQAVNVCRRCVVPSRDSRTGTVGDHFRDIFESRRVRTIQPTVDATAWGHWYRLAANTIASAGTVACGDRVLLT